VEIGDGDLVRLARAGDAAAFRLLVERHRMMALARAAWLCTHHDDVDDIVQESFLQAFVALDRLRDPDRFGAWLAGIVRNVHRAATRRPPVMLLAEWPEDLHPASADGLPSADDLDRAEALRAAVADLPDAQRRAVELYYYADLPAAQIAGSPAAAKTRLHKARRRLREHIAAHRPDLIPVTVRRRPMTTVRIAHAEPHLDTRLDGSIAIRHILVVLADDQRHRAMGLWLRTREGMQLWHVLDRPARAGEAPEPSGPQPQPEVPGREFTAEDLAVSLLGAAGGAVTGVDLEELGPNVLAARIGVASPAGTKQVTAPPGSALALAATLDAPVRVADALMDRLAVPVAGDDLLGPFVRRAPARPGGSCYGPRNLAFADGLDGWIVGGSSRAEVTGSHWDDYAVATTDGTATLSAAVPEPFGDVFLGQEFLADDYRGATLTLRAEVRGENVANHAELSLGIVTKAEDPGGDRKAPAADGHAAPAFRPAAARRTRRAMQRHGQTITGSQDWTCYEVTAQIPGDAEHLGFELSLIGPGRVALRHVELTRTG
jgi:RNA polymerase sigma factor (sigma-70 family)